MNSQSNMLRIAPLLSIMAAAIVSVFLVHVSFANTELQQEDPVAEKSVIDQPEQAFERLEIDLCCDLPVQLVSAEPHYVNSKIVGYKVFPKQKVEFFERFGILEGDIATQLNHVILNSEKQAVRALRVAKKMDVIDLTILRAGVEIILYYEIVSRP